MEVRKSNLIVGQAGGTAGKGAKTYKISIPSAWIKELNLGADEREIELFFDNDQIIIRKPVTIEAFSEECRTLMHDVQILRYYDSDELCSTICADFTAKVIKVENHTPKLIKTAFGKNEFPTWEDFEDFLKERCIPKARSGLREYLETIGVCEYDPIEIIKKTDGRMAEDNQWMEIEVL